MDTTPPAKLHVPPPLPYADPPGDQPRQRLGLLDAASIIVGIIIGAGFLHSSPLVASSAGSAGVALAMWGVGAALAVVGAMCYAEMATRFPREGGDYVFLSAAFGRGTGFLFAWLSLLVVRPGNIGSMAVVFGVYASQLTPLPGLGSGPAAQLVWACGAVSAATAVNLVGLQGGRWAQHLLTGAKVLGLAALSGVALLGPAAAEPAATSQPADVTVGGLTLALVMVMFAYGGWADVTYVAAEVRNPRKNLWRALLLGTAAVAAIYLVGTVGFFRSLGFAGVSGSQAVAADVLRRPLGDAAARAISLLVCVSCLGAINGMVLTGSRVFFAVGQDHRVFRWLAAWNGRRGVPVRSMLVQSAVTLGLLLAFARSADGFERMVIFSTPPFWFFFLLAGVAVFVFRSRGDRAGHATYRVPLYPLTPILFCLSSLLLVEESTRYAWNHQTPEAIWTVAVLVSGVGLAAWESTRWRGPDDGRGFEVLQR